MTTVMLGSNLPSMSYLSDVIHHTRHTGHQLGYKYKMAVLPLAMIGFVKGCSLFMWQINGEIGRGDVIALLPSRLHSY